ncbi:MAG: glycoside hydrolase family 9 protein [Chitinophagaceae bacterium]|nr:glycoside hydrolase family 9 protein [Chitinophagaceae bacterium]
MGFSSSATKRWIRINQLGYLPGSIKVAVWCSKDNGKLKRFEVVDATTGVVVFKGNAGKSFGAYGPFKNTYRLNFSEVKAPGKYVIRTGKTKSPVFEIGADVYKGSADFTLFYMRQQRCGFNPFIKDSCHTHDGYTRYGPMPDSTHIDVVGGWHDATDYLQYATTTANATWHLLAAQRDFPDVFTDVKNANGLDGSNGIPDVLDEAKWGLDFLLKLHPRKDWMFNQVADDRDHKGLRLPKEDAFYGRGFERPVYFINGEPQQQGKGMNHTEGTSSTAAKMASAFALGSHMFGSINNSFADILKEKSQTALAYAQIKHGVTQTVSVVSPYIYAEENWMDDMQLAFASLKKYVTTGRSGYNDSALHYSALEKITPWMVRDTASHYQYYPFINIGHYELANQLEGKDKAEVLSYYKMGIDAVNERAAKNAFLRGVPFIWCSNNLTTSFAIQCYWYQKLSGDDQYEELMQANIDWLFGCNPWGTSMVYGLPERGDYPEDPHAAYTHLNSGPIYGGLVDGPVYASIFNSLIGIKLVDEDEYAEFQSDLVVYHDDYGDYSSNEPTMDGTASLVYLLAAMESKK